MHAIRSPRGSAPVVVAVALGLVAAVAILASGLAAGGSVDPSPSAPSSPEPSPSAPASPSPSPSPSEPAEDDVIELDIATRHRILVTVSDETGVITGARSGRAGDGMSVNWMTVKAENVDADTVRLTWIGYPQDETVELTVSGLEGALAISIVTDRPLPNTDAMGYDRVLELDFAAPVRAEDLELSISEG